LDWQIAVSVRSRTRSDSAKMPIYFPVPELHGRIIGIRGNQIARFGCKWCYIWRAINRSCFIFIGQRARHVEPQTAINSSRSARTQCNWWENHEYKTLTKIMFSERRKECRKHGNIRSDAERMYLQSKPAPRRVKQ
jgi:hypothetical protein